MPERERTSATCAIAGKFPGSAASGKNNQKKVFNKAKNTNDCCRMSRRFIPCCTTGKRRLGFSMHRPSLGRYLEGRGGPKNRGGVFADDGEPAGVLRFFARCGCLAAAALLVSSCALKAQVVHGGSRSERNPFPLPNWTAPEDGKTGARARPRRGRGVFN